MPARSWARWTPLAALLALPFVHACGESGPSQQGNPPPEAHPGREATVAVTGTIRQRITGWGASVVADTTNDPLVVPNLPPRDLDRLDRLVFEGAGINLIRVFGPGYGTQLSSRDVRPRRGDPRFAFMRRVRLYGVRFMLTGADAPTRLKAGGELQGGTLAAGAEDGYARYLVRLIRFAREETGAPFDYVAISNEPDNGRMLLTMSPQQAADVYERLAERLRTEPSPPMLVVGDNINWSRTLEYARVILRQPDVPGAAAVIASHSYGGHPEDMRAVAKLARSSRTSVWQTEWGTGCVDCPDDPSIDVALQWSQQIAAALVEAQASAWFAFRPVASSDHGPGDGLIVRTGGAGEPFYTTRRFDVFRQYSSVATPGSRRLQTRDAGADVLPVAFRTKRGVAVVLTNSLATETGLSLDLGRRRGRLVGRRTDAEQSFGPLRSLVYAGRPVHLSLPARSVTTFVLTP